MKNMPLGVRPGLRFLPPATNPWLLRVAPLGSWLNVRFGSRVRKEELHGIERLIDAYRRMQDGEVRLIVAFRHPGVEDGMVVFRLLNGIVGREARRLGIPLRWPPRGYMLYGRDVPYWAGEFLNWMFPLLGAISVFPGRYDSQSIATMRRTLTEMPHPIALAPEGQVSYHNERVARLEGGTAQLGFWCMEDLKKQARKEEVLIVPVCTSYHYDPGDWNGLVRLLEKIEKECGLASLEGLSPRGQRDRTPPDDDTRRKICIRVTRASRQLVRIAEDFYSRFYGIPFPPPQDEESDAVLQERLRGVCDSALSVAERFFHLKPKGDFVQRVFACRQAGLAWMFREDIADIDALPPVDRAMADRMALETWLAARHVELVDLLEYLRVDYLRPDSGFDRFVEFITNLWDAVNRLEGGDISGRINPFRKTARIVVNEPILVSSHWGSYRENRRRAVSALTAEIHESFRRVAENDNRPISPAR
jgi:hypothetical protein